MSKAKKSLREIRKEDNTFIGKFDINSIIPGNYQTLISIIILLILFFIYFSPMYFGDKTFSSGDIMTSKAMTNYVKNYQGDYTLWNPYIFGGLPAHALSVGYKWFNVIYVAITSVKSAFVSLFDVKYTQWTLYLILLAITTFFLIRYKTGNTLVSLFAGVATSFSTGLIVFLFIGHVTKLTAICMYPLIFLILLKFQNRIKLLDFAILVLALQLLVQGWHVQIIFYTLLAVGIYFLYYFLRSIIKKEKHLTNQLLKSAGLFVLGSLIALAIQSDNFTQIYNYTPYSTRGEKSIVEKQALPEKMDQSAFYQYATDWSFSPGEVMTFIIPSYYGFGNVKYSGELTRNQEINLNTYFGQMRMVDVAMYMGVIVFFLGLFAIFTRWKDPFVQFLTIVAGFALFLSFGRNFPIIFDPMFNYFPFFDKFRVPSMALVLVQLCFPLLAALGLEKIISMRNDKDTRAEKIIKYAAYAFTGLFVISIILSGALKDMITSRFQESEKGSQMVRYFQQYNFDISKVVSGMFLSDTLIAFTLCALTFWMSILYTKAKMSRDILAILIIVFVIFDLWRIDKRGEQYIPLQNEDAAFIEPNYVKTIKQQNDNTPFRILNLKQDNSPGTIAANQNYHAYFLIQDLSGYSGVKPRTYQDIMDVLGGGPVNETLWRMLNVRYLITDRPYNIPWLSFIDSSNGTIVYKNLNALQRAYFVNSVETKPMIQVLNLIKNNSFDPKNVAFIEEGSLKVDKPDSSARADIKSYMDEHITIQAKATGNNLLFLGDTYYPKGWKAYIDGKETMIYRINHGFRGVIVPRGEHKVEFIYAPKSFYISMYTSLVLSSLVFVGIIAGIFMELRKKKTQGIAV